MREDITRRNRFVTNLLSAFLISFIFCLTNFVSTAEAGPPPNGIIANTSAEHRKQIEIYEKNGMSETLCMIVNLLSGGIARAGAVFIVAILAFAAFTGKLNVSMVVAFALGVGGFFAAPSILSLIAPSSDVGSGCKCKEYILIGYDAQQDKRIYTPTNLNPDCSRKTGS